MHINSIDLINLPAEMQKEIVNYLSIGDLNVCLRVSRTWYELFNSEMMWEPSALKMNFKRLKTHSLKHLDLLAKNRYKYLLYQKFSQEEEIIRSRYPPEFLEIFDGAAAIRRLPSVKLTNCDLFNENFPSRDPLFKFKEHHFTHPIVRVALERPLTSTQYFILIRIINNATKKIYRDVIGFEQVDDHRCFSGKSFDYNSLIRGQYMILTKKKLERLKRLIRREPVGSIIAENIGDITEGERLLPNGKSVYELF